MVRGIHLELVWSASQLSFFDSTINRTLESTKARAFKKQSLLLFIHSLFSDKSTCIYWPTFPFILQKKLSNQNKKKISIPTKKGIPIKMVIDSNTWNKRKKERKEKPNQTAKRIGRTLFLLKKEKRISNAYVVHATKKRLGLNRNT